MQGYTLNPFTEQDKEIQRNTFPLLINYSINMNNDFNETSSAVDGINQNVGVPFQIGARAVPLDPREIFTPDDVFDDSEVNNDAKLNKPPDRLPPPPPNVNGIENVTADNNEVVIRNPIIQRQLSKAPSTPPGISHSHSTSDLIRLRNPHYKGNPKDPRTMILPISRPRSLNQHTLSQDGLNLVGSYGNNPPSSGYGTPQVEFSPYVSNNPNNIYGTGFDYSVGGYLASNTEIDRQSGHRNGRKMHLSVTSTSSHLKAPTSPETKKDMFTDILTSSLSTIYAIFIITLGIIFYVVDYLDVDDNDVGYLAEGFSLTLLGLALLYLLFLNVDIALYNSKKRRFEKLIENMDPEYMEMKETDEGISYDIMLQKTLSLKKELDHRYCFNMDRHSSNFYLKVGAAGFCFGHLIHSFLILTYRGILLSAGEDTYKECVSVVTFVIEILYPIYSISLLFFIFKYSNVIINKNRDFHRFGFMHCLASSLCFWLWTIFRETSEYIRNSSYPKDDDENATTTQSTVFRSHMIVPFRFTAMCEHDQMNVIYHDYSPYLYPFSVEYSILVVGIIYICWVNIGLCNGNDDSDNHHHGEDTRECRNDRRPSEPESNMTIHADCHASNKGLFGGFIVLVFAIVSVILFFITVNSTTELAETGLVFNQSTKIAIIFIMILAVLFAYFQMIKLDVNQEAHNSLDNFLCLICLPAFFIHGIFSIIPGVIYGNALAVTGIILEIIQVVIQTPFIMDGMSRASNTKILRKKKPGREFVTFLVICNVAMWFMQTFEVKSHGLDQYRQDFYSKELWSILGHMCLPLMMFYRFHSSVCIGDIWKFAYMPSGH